MNKIIYDKIELFFTQKESNKYEHAANWKVVPVVVCNWLPRTKKTKRLIPKPHQPNFDLVRKFLNQTPGEMKESAKVFSADPKSLPKHNYHLIKNKNMLTHLLFIMKKENIYDQDFAQNVLKISYYRYSRLSRKFLHKIKLNKHENIVCLKI